MNDVFLSLLDKFTTESSVFVCLITLSCKGLTKKLWCIITQSLAMEQEQKVSELN